MILLFVRLLGIHDPKWGQKLEEVSESGIVSKYQYDGFGRVKEQRDHNGNITEYKLEWDIGNSNSSSPLNSNNSIYSSKIQNPDGSHVKIWYDSFERERKREESGFNQPTYKITSYDSRGNVKTSTAPYFLGSSNIILNTNTYNRFNRIGTSSSQLGTTSYTYNYSGGNLETIITCLLYTSPSPRDRG